MLVRMSGVRDVSVLKRNRIVASEDADIVDRAIGWHLRQAELTAGEWRSFIAWLEADPAHARAFDQIAFDDRLMAERPGLARSVAAAVDPVQSIKRPRRPWLWAAGGTAIAAGIVAVLVPVALPRAPDSYLLATALGQRKDVRLADGTRIELSGGTRLRLDRADPRIASLDYGEATFHVRHDDRNPFTLKSGDLTIQDLGTVFNVSREGQRLDVQVAEGAVVFQPGREALTLKPGSALSAREDLHSVTLSRIEPGTVGGWRSGELTFNGETLGTVFDTIHRLYGIAGYVGAGLVDAALYRHDPADRRSGKGHSAPRRADRGRVAT